MTTLTYQLMDNTILELPVWLAHSVYSDRAHVVIVNDNYKYLLDSASEDLPLEAREPLLYSICA